jgi:Ca2+-binding RTX toxin-like protein
VLVSDPSGIVASSGCATVLSAPLTEVRCPKRGSLTGDVRAGAGDDVVKAPLDVDGGDGDDVLDGRGSLSGGAGDDVLTGSEGADQLDGGPGADALDGRGGSGAIDIAIYVDRDENLDADLGNGVVRVGSGETDRLVGVEAILAGRGADRLIGSASDDVLYGGPGDDTLFGGPGADTLLDASGHDTLDGGPGDDRLSTNSQVNAAGIPPVVKGIRLGAGPTGAAVMLGGPGDDGLLSGFGSDRIDGGTGRDAITTKGGSDRAWLRDGQADQVRCGRRSVIRADRRDLTSGCRRLDRTGVPRPVITSVGGVIFEENDGSEAFVDIACSDDQRRGCRGQLRVIAWGRTVGRRRFAVRPGGRTFLENIPLDPRVRREAARRGRLAVVYRVDTTDARGRPVVLRRKGAFCPNRDPRDCR